MTSTAVQKHPNPIRDALERQAPSYAKLLPKNYPVDRLITGALLAVTLNPDLAKCTPVSIATALAKVAQLGLDVGDTAHLVPFGAACTMIVDYKGLIKLLCEAGARKVEAREVREGDEFAYRYGTEPYLRHVPTRASEGRKIVAAYAIAFLRGGVTQFEVMLADEIDLIRQKHSKQWKNGPLTYWYGRKCTIRRLAKYVARTPKLVAALEDEDFDPETGEVLNQDQAPVESTAAVVVQGDAFVEDEADGS